MSVLIVDGDYIPWTVSYNCRESEFPHEIEEEVDKVIERLVALSGCNSIVGFLGAPGTPSFRAHVATLRPYKGQRSERPPYFEMWAKTVTSHLVNKYDFRFADMHPTLEGAYETDDMVASYAAKLRDSKTSHVVCSSDKDLNQIPGNRIQAGKMTTIDISSSEAKSSLWGQALMGDATDNIPGLPKIGPVKANEILVRADVAEELPHIVLQTYMNHYGEMLGIQYFAENYRLVKLVTDIPLELREGYKLDEQIML